MKVLDKGFVELVAHSGGDLSVVNSARVSFGQHVTVMSEADEKLIGFLMRNKHGTPFEHNLFTFRVKAPIFVLREWHRHRVGISINEQSARYMKLTGDWYIPDKANVRRRIGKPGNYSYEPVDSLTAAIFVDRLNGRCEDSYLGYTEALEEGIAPEQARMFLHVNHYSEMYWTCNARSLMHFLELRMAETAQWEIRQFADAMFDLASQAMPVTFGAFRGSECVAP